jgi:hypothetical protein
MDSWQQSCRQIRIFKNILIKILVNKQPVTRIKKRLADKGTCRQAGREEERHAGRHTSRGRRKKNDQELS